MKPQLWTFPTRNRIVAGLSSLGVLVIEAGDKSGSLITAKLAKEMRRPVWAVPGPITSSMSKGPYKLIAKGAKLVTSADDILKELKFQNQNPKSQINSKSKITNRKGDTKEENLILKLLQDEPLHFDELVRRTKFNPSKLSSLLSMMEIKGMIKNLNNGTFSLLD